ncbi:MAG: radical SAM protein [Spirochaetes bacterium]|nr:radical SAM protein [Spirochaetota bacterium]MBN2769584.1 radical SAM protein [Spirochaetota bacterium]
MRLILRFIFKINAGCRRKFIRNLVIKGVGTLRTFRRRKKNGGHFPAFHFISITNRCNLACQGCWVSRSDEGTDLPLDRIDAIIAEGKRNKSYFYGLLGGEPLLYPQLFDIVSNHSDCYFQLFTNGLLLDDTVADRILECGNVTPLISLEGNQTAADIRRGGSDVYRQTVDAIKRCTSRGIITGVAMSVCKSNYDMALDRSFLKELWKMGVVYLWYYIYRPVGENPCYELALESDQIESLRRFMIDERKSQPLIIVDSYWNADGAPFCPAAEGLSHHINPAGYVEPCPVLQFSHDKIGKDTDINAFYNQGAFLPSFKRALCDKTDGCILMEDPKWLADYIIKSEAINTSNRKHYINMLGDAPTLCSHSVASSIKEKSFFYRFAKRHAFFGMGAYG